MTENASDIQGWSSSLKAKSERCHLSSWEALQESGEIPRNYASHEWCLHHIDPTQLYFDPEGYASWALSDVQAMTTSEHMRLHRDFEKRNLQTGFLDELMLMRMNAEVKANAHH